MLGGSSRVDLEILVKICLTEKSLSKLPAAGKSVNEYLAAMRGEHVRDDLGVGGPLHHLQHDRATREEEVRETGRLSRVDVGGCDPVAARAVVQLSCSAAPTEESNHVML